AGGKVLLVAGEHAADRPSELARQERGDDRVLAAGQLRAETAAHVLAVHADVTERDLERGLQRLADAEHRLRRLPDRELGALPARDRPVRLERVVELRRSAIRRLDDRLGGGERALD